MGTIPIYTEIDRTAARQAAQGKDNPELSAHCQKVIDLLNRKLDLQNQSAAVESDLNAERQTLRQTAAPRGTSAAVPLAPNAPKAGESAATVQPLLATPQTAGGSCCGGQSGGCGQSSCGQQVKATTAGGSCGCGGK